MDSGLLIAVIVVQIALGSYVLSKNPRARANRVFAWCLLFYALGSFAGLLRSVTVDQLVAAHLLVFGTIVVHVWIATFIGLAVLVVFYSGQFERYRFWTFYLPIGLGVLATMSVLAFYIAVPDKVDVVTLITGTSVYEANSQAFPIRGWSVLYVVVWSIVAVSLLVNVVVRRHRGERRSAVMLGILILLSAVAASLGPRLLPGSLKVTGPALSNALLSIAFTCVVIHYRLFSAQDVAVRLALDNLNDGILVLQADRTVLSCNARATELLGLPREAMVNVRVDGVLARSALPSEVWRDLWARLRQGQGSTSEARYMLGEDEQIISNKVIPIYDAQQAIEGYVWMISNVTLLRRGEEQIEARNRELQEAVRELRSTSEIQQRLLETVRSLSAPAVPIMEGIIVMPLSGQIDSLRAQRILDNLLEGIGDYQAKIALIDITGVPVVDTAVAQYLIQAARAASLMGCHPILVGIRPEIAQVIVELGIDMSGLVTFSDLQSGFEYALRTLGIGLVHTTSG